MVLLKVVSPGAIFVVVPVVVVLAAVRNNEAMY